MFTYMRFICCCLGYMSFLFWLLLLCCVVYGDKRGYLVCEYSNIRSLKKISHKTNLFTFFILNYDRNKFSESENIPKNKNKEEGKEIIIALVANELASGLDSYLK